MRGILGLLFSKQIMASCLLGGPGAYCNSEIIPLPQGDMTEIKSVPNSDWLVGVTSANGQKDLFALNSKSFEFHFLTENTFDEDSPSFSPDGKQLVFISRENDPLGDIAISEFVPKKNPKLLLKSQVVRPFSQESSPRFNGSKLVFFSRRSSDQSFGLFEMTAPLRSFFSPGLNDEAQKILEIEENPILSSEGKIFFGLRGSIFYHENGKTVRVIGDDGFLRRAFEYYSSDKIRYLRYSADSNGDGVIDARDASEVVELEWSKSSLSKPRERILLYKSNQIAQFSTKNDALFFSERTQSGYVITKNDPKQLSCDLSRARKFEQYENYISVCSAEDFGDEVSAVWRFYVRNHLLSGRKDSEEVLNKICESSGCGGSNILKKLTSDLKAIASGRHSEFPEEMVVDWALRSKTLTSDLALKVLKRHPSLSYFSLKRIVDLVGLLPDSSLHLREIGRQNPGELAYLASLEIAKKLQSIGKTDLSLNEVISIIERFKNVQLDVSEAVELAGKYALAAKLRGFMKGPLTELLHDNSFESAQKEAVFRAAAKTLVLEGSHALEEAQTDQAQASFELALKFQPEDLRALKELSSMGISFKPGNSLAQLIEKTFKVEKLKNASERRELLLALNDDLKEVGDKFYFEAEYHLIIAWVNYQIYLTEKVADNSFGNWWYGKLKTAKKIFGLNINDHLKEAKASLERAESIERSQGEPSERLSQSLAVVLFEIGDYKKALRHALKRIEALDSLEFSDAEVGHYFLSLASSAAGKIDEYSLAIQLASEAEAIAQKIDVNNLEKIKRAKIYLYFQNGDFASAAREITQIIRIVKPSEIEGARLKVLRAWFYKLSNRSQLARSSLASLSLTEENALKNSKFSTHFNLLKWLQRELAVLPKDESLLFDSIRNQEAKSGYFERTFDKVLGKNQAFSDRAKKSVDTAQRFADAGLNAQALSSLLLAEKDIGFLANDVDNREGPSIIGNWLDLRIVLSLNDQGAIDSMISDLLTATRKSCDKLENSKKNKNCLALIGAISARQALRSLNYTGPLTAHAVRSFAWSKPEQILEYSAAESRLERGKTDWLRLVSAGSILDGLMAWSKGVINGDLKDFDLSEVDEYYNRLDQNQKDLIDHSKFRFARILRLRQKMGLETESLRRNFLVLEQPKTQVFLEKNSPFLKNTLGIFFGEAFMPRAIVLDPFAKANRIQGDRMFYHISQADLLTFIPMIYNLQSASMSEFLARLDDFRTALNPPDPDPALTDLSQPLGTQVSDSFTTSPAATENQITDTKSPLTSHSNKNVKEDLSEKGPDGVRKDSRPSPQSDAALSASKPQMAGARVGKVQLSPHVPLNEVSPKPTVEGQALIVCGFGKDTKLRDFDELYARSWDLYQGRVFLSKDCDQNEMVAAPEETYFDDIDNQLDKKQYFDAWNTGLARLKISKVDSDLWDTFARELVSKGHYWGAYVGYDMKRFFLPDSTAASLSGMATMAFFEKKWDLAEGHINALMQLSSGVGGTTDNAKTSHLGQADDQKVEDNATKKSSVNVLEILRMKAVLAENTLDPVKVASTWQELIEASKKLGNDTMLLRGLNSLGNYYLDKAFDPASARESFDRALSFAKSKQIDSFDASFGLAMADMRTNSFNKALARLYQLEGSLSSGSSPLLKLRLNQQISSGLLGVGKLSQSLEKLRESSTLIASLPSASQRNRYEILKLNLEAMIYGRQGWRRKANDTFSKALGLAKNSQLNDLAAILHANQGYWDRVFGDIDASLASYNQAMGLSSKSDLTARASDLRNVGLANLSGGRLGIAEINLIEAEELSSKLGLKQNLGLSRIGLAQIYFLRSQWTKALGKADDAVRIFSEEFLIENYTRALFGRSMILAALGRKREAQSDLMRAVLINFKSYPGQRIGHSSQDLWVDLTIRDIFDTWLERHGTEKPLRSLGLMAFWQRRQTVDRLLTIDSAQSKLLEPLASFSGHLLDESSVLKLSDKEIELEVDQLSETTREKLPSDMLLLWSFKQSVLTMYFSNQELKWKLLPVDRKNFLRYGDFSDRLLEFMGDTQLFSRLWYAELLAPNFGDHPPKSMAFLTSDEFDDFPLELLAPDSSQPIALVSQVRRLMGGVQSSTGELDSLSGSDKSSPIPVKMSDNHHSVGKVSGFLAGSRFKDRQTLPLVEEEAKLFRNYLGSDVYLNAQWPKKSFNFLQISGHLYLENSETPKLALGPLASLDPSQMLEKLPSANSLFLNTCGVKNGSHLLRSIASLRGARHMIDANGKLAEMSSFTMSKELLPRIASGQDLNKALQESQAIISKKGKHPSYWARFRYWDIF